MEGQLLPFPADSRGFIYYHTSPSIPKTAGELRFRLTQGDDPQRFQSGSDLLLVDGLPWNIPLAAIAHNRTHRIFRRLLLRDNLVSPALMDLCAGFPITRSRSRVIHSLGQPFHVEFHHIHTAFLILSGSTCSRLILPRIFVHAAGDGTPIIPYSGE